MGWQARHLERSRRRWMWATLTAFALAAVFAGALACVLFLLLSRTASLADDRLLGTWQSDREQTMKDFVKGHRPDDELAAAFGRLFGKLRVTYDGSTYTADLEGFVQRFPYTVVARDDHSVVFRAPDPLTGEEMLTQIHFVNADTYYLHIRGMAFREYFVRVR